MKWPDPSALERLPAVPPSWHGLTAYRITDDSAAPRYPCGDILVLNERGEEVPTVPRRTFEQLLSRNPGATP